MGRAMSSVVLATAGYDHQIKFWEATSGICYRTVQYADSQVRGMAQGLRGQRCAARPNHPAPRPVPTTGTHARKLPTTTINIPTTPTHPRTRSTGWR